MKLRAVVIINHANRAKRGELMKKKFRITTLGMMVVALYGGVASPSLRADATATLDIDVNKPGVAIPKTFYGLMTEEINHAYDGGLYAELIQNRSFQDPPPRGRGATTQPSIAVRWSIVGDGKASLDRNDPVNPALPVSLRLELSGSMAGVANEGYWGFPIRPDTTYTASFYAKASGGFAGPITAALVLDEGQLAVAKGDSPAISASWQKYTVKLATGHDAPTTTKAHFILSARGNGSVTFSMVSLFPPTYQNAPNGL